MAFFDSIKVCICLYASTSVEKPLHLLHTILIHLIIKYKIYLQATEDTNLVQPKKKSKQIPNKMQWHDSHEYLYASLTQKIK